MKRKVAVLVLLLGAVGECLQQRRHDLDGSLLRGRVMQRELAVLVLLGAVSEEVRADAGPDAGLGERLNMILVFFDLCVMM